MNVLWLALDEPLADLVRRLHGYGARGDRVFVVRQRPSMAELMGLITELEIGLVIIDTAAEFATGLVDDFSSAAQWTPLLKALRGALEQTGCAGVLLHHTTRAGDRYADSRALGAGVDVILTMLRDGEDTTVRKIKALGRIPVADFRIRFDGSRYEVDGGELPMGTRIYRVISAQPGIGKGKLRAVVGGASKDVDAELKVLLQTKAVEDRGERGRCAFYAVPWMTTEAGPGKELVKPESDDVTRLSQMESSVSHAPSHAPLTAPYKKGASQGDGGEVLNGGKAPLWRRPVVLDPPRCSLHPSIPERRRRDGTTRCPVCVPNNPRNPYLEPLGVSA